MFVFGDTEFAGDADEDGDLDVVEPDTQAAQKVALFEDYPRTGRSCRPNTTERRRLTSSIPDGGIREPNPGIASQLSEPAHSGST